LALCQVLDDSFKIQRWRLRHSNGMGHALKNVGLQHKVFTHYGKSNVIARYGKEKMTSHIGKIL
jgi:hypothetical protein